MEFHGGQKAGESLNSDINVTPLVDVMLVMLIIFMLVTPMLQKGVGVELPKARHVQAVPEERSQVLLVVLQENGQMYVDDQPTERAALAGALQARRQLNPGLQLQVKADRSVPYGEVKKIIQAGRQAGFEGAALIAEEIRDELRAGGGARSGAAGGAPSGAPGSTAGSTSGGIR